MRIVRRDARLAQTLRRRRKRQSIRRKRQSIRRKTWLLKKMPEMGATGIMCASKRLQGQGMRLAWWSYVARRLLLHEISVWPLKYLIMKPPHTTDARPIAANRGTTCTPEERYCCPTGSHTCAGATSKRQRIKSRQARAKQGATRCHWGQGTRALQASTRSSSPAHRAGSPASSSRRPPNLPGVGERYASKSSLRRAHDFSPPHQRGFELIPMTALTHVF